MTLRHFASADALDLLRRRHAHRGAPMWTTAIREEVQAGLRKRQWHCKKILDCKWLGEPPEPTTDDLKEIIRLQRGLNLGRDPEPAGAHLGEAEAIHYAKQHGGIVATDDAEAYEFARRHLGPGRVIDLVEILQSSVAAGDVTAAGAADIARSVSDSGRSIRRVHPAYPDAQYFS